MLLAVNSCASRFGPEAETSETAPEPQQESARPGKQKLRPIRHFDVATLARLGRALYRHDQLASKATELLVAKLGPEALTVPTARGWVVDLSGKEPLVRCLRKAQGGVEAAYDVRFPHGQEPLLEPAKEPRLSPAQLSRVLARDTAARRLSDENHRFCPVRNGSYHTAVLDDPSGSGFLVYFLRPKDSDEIVPVGGHYRVSVADDSQTVLGVDRLSASCVSLKRGEGLPQGSQVVAFTINHVLSDTPIETHVFLSLQERVPIYVLTPGGRTWKVDRGAIEQAGPAPAE